jgi:hypothetical protein
MMTPMHAIDWLIAGRRRSFGQWNMGILPADL